MAGPSTPSKLKHKISKILNLNNPKTVDVDIETIMKDPLYQQVEQCAIHYPTVHCLFSKHHFKDMKDLADEIVKLTKEEEEKNAGAVTTAAKRVSIIQRPSIDVRAAEQTLKDNRRNMRSAVVWLAPKEHVRKNPNGEGDVEELPSDEAADLVWMLWYEHSSENYKAHFGDKGIIGDYKRYYKHCRTVLRTKTRKHYLPPVQDELGINHAILNIDVYGIGEGA